MEPRSPWVSSHGERESIPTIKIELAGFGIGKLLSLRNTTFTTANGPFPFLHGTHHCAALASSQVQRTRARTRELDMESIREHSDGLEQNRERADGLARHNRQGTPDVASRRCRRRCREQGRAQEGSMRHRLLALLI